MKLANKFSKNWLIVFLIVSIILVGTFPFWPYYPVITAYTLTGLDGVATDQTFNTKFQPIFVEEDGNLVFVSGGFTVNDNNPSMNLDRHMRKLIVGKQIRCMKTYQLSLIQRNTGTLREYLNGVKFYIETLRVGTFLNRNLTMKACF